MVHRNHYAVTEQNLARQDAHAGLPCAHLACYRTRAIAERELVRIQNALDNRPKPKYVFQCDAPCLGWHMGARTDEQKMAIAVAKYRVAMMDKPVDANAPWTLSTSGWMDL